MRTWMIWQGGPSYVVSDIADVEEFPTLAAAIAEYEHRASGVDRYYPAVEDSEGHLFFYDPRKDDPYRDHYPDRIIRQGPRGGTVVERV